MRVVEFVCGMGGVIVLFLTYPFIAMMIKLDSKGPVMDSSLQIGEDRRKRTRGNASGHAGEERRGRNLGGKPFRALSYRISSGATLTRVGRLLKKSRLHKVPLFLNLIRGDAHLPVLAGIPREEIAQKSEGISIGSDRQLNLLRVSDKTPAEPLQTPSRVRNFLTVDVECWFHAYNIGDQVPRSTWHLQETQIMRNMDRLLLMLAAHDTKATFFVLGWVADHFPEVVRMINAEGHEIATHGYHHELVTRMTPQQFEADLLQSLEAINRHTSQEVLGHRASNFTVVKDTLWSLEILAKNGLRYDSSIFPISRKRYGIPDYPHRNPHTLRMPDGKSLIELPMSTAKLGSKLLPFAGGGYFRLYPYQLTAAFIENMNRNDLPATVYLHPWELDNEQARYFLGASKTFQHYVNLEGTAEKLDRLLENFSFTSVKDGLFGVRGMVQENVIPLQTLYESPGIALSNSNYLRRMSGKNPEARAVPETPAVHTLAN